MYNDSKRNLNGRFGLDDGHHRTLTLDEAMALLLTERVALEAERATNDALRAEIRALKKESLTDSLTGVFNRRRLDNFEHSQENWLLIIDLDGLKTINDTLGHNAGDRAIVTAADFLKANVRERDIVVRMGGDEFAILLRGADEADAAAKVQKLQRGFDSLSFDWNDEAIPVRASIGNAPFSPDKTLDNVVAEADQEMYATKRAKGVARKGSAFGLS